MLNLQRFVDRSTLQSRPGNCWGFGGLGVSSEKHVSRLQGFEIRGLGFTWLWDLRLQSLTSRGFPVSGLGLCGLVFWSNQAVFGVRVWGVRPSVIIEASV